MRTFVKDSTAIIFGVGLMGQHCAETMLRELKLEKLILVELNDTIKVAGADTPLSEFASSLGYPNGTEIICFTGDIADETRMKELFTTQVKEGEVDYLVVTSGISPRPLTPPENLELDFYADVIRVNTLGPINIINTAVREGALAESSRAVLMISTSATNGAEGRATAAYEVSKGGLLNFLEMQAGYYASQHGLVMNGISPNPLKGPMATGNPVSARRVADVIAHTPMGSLTTPINVTAQILFFLSNECWSAGKNIEIDGGYACPRVYYGDLPGQGENA